MHADFKKLHQQTGVLRRLAAAGEFLAFRFILDSLEANAGRKAYFKKFVILIEAKRTSIYFSEMWVLWLTNSSLLWSAIDS